MKSVWRPCCSTAPVSWCGIVEGALLYIWLLPVATWGFWVVCYMQLSLWIPSLSSRTTRDTHLCIGPVTMVTTEIHTAFLFFFFLFSTLPDDKVIFHGYILSVQMTHVSSFRLSFPDLIQVMTRVLKCCWNKSCSTRQGATPSAHFIVPCKSDRSWGGLGGRDEELSTRYKLSVYFELQDKRQ